MVKYDNRPCCIGTGEFVFPKFLYARTTNNKTIDVSYAPQSLDAVEYIRSDSLQQEQLEKVNCPFDKGNYNYCTVQLCGAREENHIETRSTAEPKKILEVFGFKVGDAVRLKDGDGRKHIIKSFKEVEGIHGPNFYQVEFEDDSARDGIYPGEEYPNGYYTQMEKFEEEPVDLEKTVEFNCIGKKVKMTVQELIDYYIDRECTDVADECGF